MVLDVISSISIEEDTLMEDFIKECPETDNEDALIWLESNEGDLWLYNWIKENSNDDYDEIEEYSYQELLKFISDNLEYYK